MATETVTGLTETITALDAARLQPALERAAGAAIAIVADAITSRTPVRTGQLQGAVQVSVLPAGPGAVARTAGFKNKEGVIAMWLEYGWMLTSHDGVPIHPVAEKPFMRPAFDESAATAIDVFAQVLSDQLKNGF
jgi:hypothetical protein